LVCATVGGSFSQGREDREYQKKTPAARNRTARIAKRSFLGEDSIFEGKGTILEGRRYVAKNCEDEATPRSTLHIPEGSLNCEAKAIPRRILLIPEG
jgi:hypothetical protein